MSYQSKGWQISLLIHAAIFSFIPSANISESRLNTPVPIDFSIIRDSEVRAEMPAPGIPGGSPLPQGEKTENRLVDDIPDQPQTPPAPPVPQKEKKMPVKAEKSQKPKEKKTVPRAEKKKSPPAKQKVENREESPVEQVQTKEESSPVVQAKETVREETAPSVSDAPHSDTEDSQPAQSLAENSAAASNGSGASDSKGRDTVAGYSKSGSGGAGNGSPGNMTFGSGGGPKYLHKEIPVYPARARRMGKEGKVVLRLTIDENGSLVNVEVIEDTGYGFAEAAIAAVKKSTFIPPTFNGRPVRARALLPVTFTLR